MAQAPDAGCALPSEPKGIPAAFDAAISGPADKDRTCMKALLILQDLTEIYFGVFPGGRERQNWRGAWYIYVPNQYGSLKQLQLRAAGNSRIQFSGAKA